MREKRLLKKIMYKKRKCVYCGKLFNLKRGFSDEFCSEKCYSNFEKILQKAKEIKPRERNVCIACGKPIKNGKLCESCFIQIAETCMQLNLKPEIIKVWKLKRTSSGKLYKMRVEAVRLVER